MAVQDLLMAADSGEGAGAGEYSFWNQMGDWAGENKDWLLAAALEANKYSKQQAAANAQNIINQAASKWSGFNPNLMQMVKPVQQPDIMEGVLGAAQRGPRMWSELSAMYKEREKGPESLRKYFEDQEQDKLLNTILKMQAGWGVPSQQAAVPKVGGK